VGQTVQAAGIGCGLFAMLIFLIPVVAGAGAIIYLWAKVYATNAGY